MRSWRYWLVYGIVAMVTVLGAGMVGQVAHEWVKSTRIENGDLGCSARGGVLDHDDLSCVRTAADGTVTDVSYSLSPTTLEATVLIAVAVVATLAVELVLFALLWLAWREVRQSSGRTAPGLPGK